MDIKDIKNTQDLLEELFSKDVLLVKLKFC